MFRPEDFAYTLPPDRIANSPATPRDHSRLMVVDRQAGSLEHKHFYDLVDLLDENDVLVRNNTKVLPARIYGQKDTGGKCELLLIKQIGFGTSGAQWECLTKPGLKLGQHISFPHSPMTAVCTQLNEFTRIIEFSLKGEEFFKQLDIIGHTPIPPYIAWESGDEQKLREVYQTTYAKILGSVAAPTAGLHFTPELDEKLREKGIQIEELTLHVGLGTFLPLQESQLQSGKLHQEELELTAETAGRINAAKLAGKRIISVGTTTTRALESCAQADGTLAPHTGVTELFIWPGYKFKVIDGLITNFHLPKSSLLMLVSAFVSAPNSRTPFETFEKSLIGNAYETAIQEKYRFYSFGDAMVIV